MAAAEPRTIHKALTEFCEQRARIEILGHQISANVGRISGLFRRADVSLTRWGSNVVSLDAARTHVDLARLFADTAHLAKLARQLHEDFLTAADDYLRESLARKTALVVARTCREAQASPVLQARIDVAITRCDKEIEQIRGLLDHSERSVALLVKAAQQVLQLRG